MLLAFTLFESIPEVWEALVMVPFYSTLKTVLVVLYQLQT